MYLAMLFGTLTDTKLVTFGLQTVRRETSLPLLQLLVGLV